MSRIMGNVQDFEKCVGLKNNMNSLNSLICFNLVRLFKCIVRQATMIWNTFTNISLNDAKLFKH